MAATLRLEPDRIIPAILQRREQAELGAGPPAGPVHLRDARQDTIDHAELAIGFRESRAPGRPVVEHEGAFIHFRKKSALGEAVGAVPRGSERQGDADHAARMIEHRSERAAVAPREVVDRAAQTLQRGRRGAGRGGRVLRVARREVPLAQERDDRARQDERHQHGDRERDRKRVKELSDDALE